MSQIEQGDPIEDSAAYRRSLGQFATGVAVITARVGDDLVGMTSNSFASVSLDPPLILWSVKRISQSFAAFIQSTHFAVNVLAADQIDVSQRFAKSGPDKFNGIPWEPGVGGAPILDGTVAAFECGHERDLEGGDHIIMLGRVERFTRTTGREALIFEQGRYATSTDHPRSAPPSASKPGFAQLRLEDESLSSLLVRAYGAFGATLAEARRLENVTLTQARLLRGIRTTPGRTLADSQLGWEHINLSGDCVWESAPSLDGDGFRQLTFTV